MILLILKHFWIVIVDITVKTVTEEYTPLHLAARFKPPRRQESVTVGDDKDEIDGSKMEGTIEADDNISSFTGQNSSEESSMIVYLLKQCKGADVHVSIQVAHG